MNSIIVIGYIIINILKLDQQEQSFSLDLLDFNYSMAYTVQYHINNDSVSVTRLNGLKGEHSINLWKQKISSTDLHNIIHLTTSSSFQNLKDKYENPLVADGDRKRVTVKIGDKQKIIDIENVYDKEIAKLIREINTILTHQYEIKYSKN